MTRVAIIGCGAFAEGQHIPNCLVHPDVEIVALCDLRRERLEELAARFGIEGAALVTDSAEVFSRPDVDAVLAATDHSAHLPLIAEAARSGKHLLIEKPMTMTHAESLQALRLVEQSGIKLCVDYNRPFSPSMQVLKEELELQRANPVLSPWRSKRAPNFPTLNEERATNLVITINDEIDSYRPQHLDPGRGGGQIIGESCHWFDLACWLIDRRPVRVLAAGSTRLSHSVILDFEDGSMATLFFSICGTFDYPKERYELTCGGALFLNEFFVETAVYGRGGTARKTYPMQCDDLRAEVPEEGFAAYLAKRELAQSRFLETGAMPALAPDKGHRALLDAFLRAVREDLPSPVDERRGARATYLANLAIQSIRTGLPVPVCREDLNAFVRP